MVKSLDDLVQPSKDDIIENLKKENKELQTTFMFSNNEEKPNPIWTR